MEIIDELETVRRGPFGGCAGYIDYSGNMDLAITIRTMLVHGEQVSLQAGAGIVADSDPRLEYKECENKARALVEAIDRAREGTD
jgi:anthranilate synthase component 1